MHTNSFGVCVIGGGHAGCEAALAAARLGARTLMLCMDTDSIAMMPCNPNIGGTSKGHLVRELDALGGEMGRNIDKTFIQSRMLNASKGPAVQSLRAQADKRRYAAEMIKTLENTPNLTIRRAEAVSINIGENGAAKSVTDESGGVIIARAVIIAAGTYLNSRCLCGETVSASGPSGLRSSARLTESLKTLGIEMFRFKTGTPARLDKKTLDFSKMREQLGDESAAPFSFENEGLDLSREQASCWLTYTNETTHSIIRENLGRSAMYSGLIEGTGTRYCPSIEDKVVRFADKDRHQVFIEPEGEDTDEMYAAGLSTSLPEDVQKEMYRSVPGLERCEITRPGYAIEYDCIDSTQLKLSLELKSVPGLFFAGQINGSSGYEEAAAQGLVAGINAARLVSGLEPLILDRSRAYIGVLIDDLVTKGTREPYRMMTSRAEYRLLLRQDNADLRLTETGREIGLISEERYKKFVEKRDIIESEIKRAASVNIAPSEEANAFLRRNGSAEISSGIKLVDLIKRPELSYRLLAEIDPGRASLPGPAAAQVNISVKFEGYIKRQQAQVEQFLRLENRPLPHPFDYGAIRGLRLEARQKLNALKPANIGQASRISGISPADISVLLVFLETMKGKFS